MEGIKQIDVESNKDFGKDFMSATAEERTKLLNKLEEVVKKFNEEVDKDEPKRKEMEEKDKTSTSSARLNIITR